MFKVKYLNFGEYTVYGVRTDTFLIRFNGLWRWVYMHDCEPVDEIRTFRQTHDD